MKLEKRSLLPIGLYLLYTFSITWFCWSVIIIGNRYFNTLWYGEPLAWILNAIGGLSPAISSYLIYQQFNKDFSEVSFVEFIFGKKINIKVWMIFGLYTVWRLLMIWIAFEVSKSITIRLIFAMTINLSFAIIFGGLEELGWRGILQPRLEKMFGYLPSVLTVGAIWGVWHLPLWLIKGTTQSEIPFELYLFSGIILTSSFTTLYKYTNNIFICVLSHAWFNVCIGLALYTDNNGALQINLNWKVIVLFVVELIASVVLGILYNRNNRRKVLSS